MLVLNGHPEGSFYRKPCEFTRTRPLSKRCAGAIAEQMLTDRSGPWGDGQDRRDAKEAAMDAAEGDRLRAAKFLAEAEHSARELVIEHAADIRTLAAAIREVPGVGIGHAEILAALGR